MSLDNLDKQNYFQLLAVPQSFALDEALLNEQYLRLQRQFHPDNFVLASDQEKRLAEQYSTLINDAYQTLKSPLTRAMHLLAQTGFVGDIETDNQLPSEFLFKQMALREQLEQLDKLESEGATPWLASLQDYDQQIDGLEQQEQQAFVESYSQQRWSGAWDAIKKMHFYSKLRAEVQQRRHRAISG